MVPLLTRNAVCVPHHVGHRPILRYYQTTASAMRSSMESSTCPDSLTGIISVHARKILRHWRRGVCRLGLVRRICAPGVIFADDDDVAPDVVWISHTRRGHSAGARRASPRRARTGHRGPVSRSTNERRDREAKLKLYSRRGVLEYWIVDWRTRQVEVYRREDLALHLVATLHPTDMLTSPLLPGFSCEVATLF